MFRWSFKHKPYNPLPFSSAELALCVLPSLYTTHYLKQRFILVYRPMLGQSAGTALDVKAGKACRTACLRTRLSALLHQKTRSMRVCPHIGSLSRFMFILFLPFYFFTLLLFYLFTFLPFYLFTFSQSPLAFSNPLASGLFIPVKSVNISIWSLVLPRLSTFSRNALPTAGSSAPCFAK